ncbi:26S proteasome regulatory subunit [Phlyctochytrium planicorne]|nr:26S proteasome regulatory subunit [Phlyctochytrium planicorne]
MGADRMDVDRDVTIYLQKAKASAPAELKEYFSKFETLYDKRLWHQLTVLIFEFIKMPSANALLVPVYEEFIADWEKKMNQLSLIQYISKAALTISDGSKALEFVTVHITRLKDQQASLDAYTLALTTAAHLKLHVAGDIAGCKADIDEAEKLLEKLPGTDPTINASFYKVAADYYKFKVALSDYYKNALLYLSSVNLEDVSDPEKRERAYDLAISALLGEGIYNFGELLMHPILDSLKGTPLDWLRELLFCFNRGDSDSFDKISRHPDFLKTRLLVSNLPALNQKLCLLSLIEAVFRRDKEHRAHLSFDQISAETKVPVADVEHLVMKALSIGLIKGSIDEIEKAVAISWVQPRVLDKTQIGSLRDRLAEWTLNVKGKVEVLENMEGADEIFVKN